MILTCAAGCGPFRRQGSRGPVPKYCSVACKTRHRRTDARREYERVYRQRRRAAGLDLVDNVARRDYYRERWRRLHGDPHIELPAPYSGHRWLDMARQAVGPMPDPEAPWADDYWDEVGEATLALLEGRDVAEAVREHRRREYVPRHRTVRMSEWHDDEAEAWREERVVPTVPSAEDEVVAREAVVYELAARYHRGRNDRPTNKSRRSHSQPTRRRMRDAGLREHRRGGLRVA